MSYLWANAVPRCKPYFGQRIWQKKGSSTLRIGRVLSAAIFCALLDPFAGCGLLVAAPPCQILKGTPMSIVPTKEQVLNDVLLSLADNFESDSPFWITIKQDSPNEFEPQRGCLTEMFSEGWLDRNGTPSRPVYKLTRAGYKHFQPQICALRVLGR
ncbi:MAG: hypothetical protein ACRD8A_20205 [Candidatus Acidiferrales bacterium]